MPYTDDEVTRVASSGGGTYLLLDPDRQADVDRDRPEHLLPGAATNENRKPIPQNAERYQIGFDLSDSTGDPDELATDEEGNQSLLAECGDGQRAIATEHALSRPDRTEHRAIRPRIGDAVPA